MPLLYGVVQGLFKSIEVTSSGASLRFNSGSTKTRFEVSFWPAVERAALLPSAVKQRINRRSGLGFDRCGCVRPME